MRTEDLTDEALVIAYQTGDQTALRVLVKRWHKAFCIKSFWIVKDADVAKDVAQESWTTIMKKIGNLQNPKSFKSWAFRIVHNKSMDVLRYELKVMSRKEVYRKEQEVSETVYNDIATEENLKAVLSKAIKKLSFEQQSVIRLFYLEEYSLKEIAYLLKVSVGTVKSRLFHAREKLKKTLKKEEHNY